ncbi:hypothetical protein ACIRCZ_19495 [Leifsonia sp. NPDC102414]|uniref:hypothetical protein n=1 Tax=Leifsonia sp. NPDC102414 TaxID=3364124 RepID=UPI00380C3142
MSTDEYGSLGDDLPLPLRPAPTNSPAAPATVDLPVTVAIVNWRELRPAESRQAWEDLAGWVRWIVYRYPLPKDVVRECWYQHGGAVEELSALHACWQASFDESDSGYGPIGFHERLDLARGRLKPLQAQCGEGHVNAPTPRVLDKPPDWDDWTRDTHADFSTNAEHEEGETNHV